MSLIRNVYRLGRSNLLKSCGIGQNVYLSNRSVSNSIISINNNNNRNNSINSKIYRNYTTTPSAADEQISLPSEDDLSEYGTKEVAKIPYQFLSLTPEQWDTTLGKEVPKNANDYFDLIESRTTLLRKPSFKAIQWLSKMKEEKFAKELPEDHCLILDGPKGVGKSITLAQVAFWAKQQNWFVVYIPDSNAFINFGGLSHFDPNPLLFGQNEIAANFIKSLIDLNEEKLKNIPIKTKFTITLTGWKPSPDSTLYDLLTTQKFDALSEVLYHFKNELNAIHEYPVLVAIDGINYFYRNSEYGDMYDPKSTFRSLATDRLVPASMFKNITSHNITNGVVVATTTNVVPKRELFSSVPQDVVTEIENYSLYEFTLFVNFLVEAQFYEKAPPRETIEYLWQMGGGNPREVWKLLSILS